MSDKPSEARAKFRDQFTNIVFMLVSVVQGLAFQKLADQINVNLHFLHLASITHQWFNASYFGAESFLAFCMIVRVFQTYITVGLDYTAEFAAFVDALVILPIGLLEFLAIAQITYKDVPPYLKTTFFYTILTCLSGLGAAIYYYNSKRVDRMMESFTSKRALHLEEKLQRENGHYTSYVAVVCGAGAFASFGSQPTLPIDSIIRLLIPLAGGGLLIAATWNSVSKTFLDRGGIRIDESLDAISDHPKPSASTGGPYCQLQTPQRGEVPEIARIVSSRYRRALASLFGLSDIEGERFLVKLVRSQGVVEKKSWQIWVDENAKVRGTCLIWKSPYHFVQSLLTMFNVLRYGGHIAARLCAENCKNHHLTTLPLRGRDWWVVPIIAVDANPENEQVLNQMVGDLVLEAKRDRRANKLKVWSRESNTSLLQILDAHHFALHHRVETAADVIVNEGELLIYECDVSLLHPQE